MSDHQPIFLLTAALLGLIACSPAGAAEPADEADDCAVLTALDFGEAMGAPVKLNAALIGATGDLPARCRITGSTAPGTGFEAWLPVDKWNGKLLVTGCDGDCGSIRTEPMEDAAARGYATATSDSAGADPEDRNLHRTAVLAKALIVAFYGDHEEHAYFRGCSNGGRQALLAAQRFPEDFDGIIAGAPYEQGRSLPHMTWAERANTGADGHPVLKKPQIELLQKAALGECDVADGLTDGVVGDPEACPFTPASLACTTGGPSACLSPEQVEAAQKIHEGEPSGAVIEPDLERFNARDGKLIVYQGWADEIAQPSHTLDYWKKALTRNGGENLGRFARLYMLPGVFHCGGGPGAGDVDYLGALERWVENDEAPDVLIAYRTKDSVSVTIRQVRFPVQGELQMKRPIFPYPDVARYSGQGDPLDPGSFTRVRK